MSIKSEASNTRYWFSPGIGGGSHGLSLGFDFTLKPGSAIISFNYINNNKDAFDVLGPQPMESATEYGILFGVATTPRGGALASLAIGFGSTHFVKRGEKSTSSFFSTTYEKITTNAGSLLLQSQLQSSSFLGLKFFLNINSEETYGGVSVCFRLGKYK